MKITLAISMLIFVTGLSLTACNKSAADTQGYADRDTAVSTTPASK
jgi:hypothetical protein